MKKQFYMSAVLSLALLPLASHADERLATAAMNRDLEGVRQLLAERGVDVNAVGPYATPALHWIVRLGELDLAKRLLDAGADPNLASGIGVVPLSVAIENSDLPMVQLLLQRGADPHARDPAGETMLMQAARTGSVEVVEELLKHKVEVDARDPRYEQTALMLAVRAGSPGAAAALVRAGADVNAQSKAEPKPRPRLPSDSSASRGKGINWGGWPERGMQPQAEGAKTPLLYATRLGNLALTKLLVEAGADIEQRDTNEITPLLNAIMNGAVANRPERKAAHIEIAHYLIEKGADVNAADWYGHTPLWAAIDLRNLDIPEPGVENGIDREAALALIKVLLERGADPNARVKEVSPLRRWITRIGNLSWVDFTGQTSFIRAALAGDVTTMKLLLEYGADPNITTFNGSTALMAAAGVNWVVAQTYDEGQEQLLEAVKLAHSLGNDINAQNTLGIAAIHGAANRGSDDIIRYLAENGADLDIADNEGRTAIDWAHGVFLATHPPVDRPETVALIESLKANKKN